MEDRFKALKSARDVSDLKGLAFEEYLRQLFQDLGYETRKTQASGDFGGDLILEKDGVTAVVQAKQYASSVGFDAVKEAFFAKSFYGANEAWVVGTGSYTSQAQVTAEKVGVKLLGGEQLDQLITRARAANETAKSSKVHSGGIGARAAKEPSFDIITRSGDTVLKQYHGASSAVVIPDGITVIGSSAFLVPPNLDVAWERGMTRPLCKHKKIETVSLPASARRIESSAFQFCVNLSEVTGGQVEEIGDLAFFGCGFTAIDILPGITYGKSVFGRQDKLREVTVTEGVVALPEGTFDSSSKLASVTIFPGLKSIGPKCFYGCSLESIEIPEGVEEIGSRCFYGCKRLANIALPSTLKKLSVDAFMGCKLTLDALLSAGLDPERTEIISSEGLKVRRDRLDDAFEQQRFIYDSPSRRKEEIGSFFGTSYDTPVKGFQRCLDMKAKIIEATDRLKEVDKAVSSEEGSMAEKLKQVSADKARANFQGNERLSALERDLENTSPYRPISRRKIRNEIQDAREALNAQVESCDATIAEIRQEAAESTSSSRNEALQLVQSIDSLLDKIMAEERMWQIPDHWVVKGTVYDDGSDPSAYSHALDWFEAHAGNYRGAYPSKNR